MKRATDMGKNVTGIEMSPIDSAKLVECAENAPAPPGDEDAIRGVREAFTAETGVVGTVPPPATLKGLAHAALDAIRGKRATVFIDRLGERLAFERTGTRLYEAMIAKIDALGSFDGGPTRDRLVEIRDEEIAHIGVLEEAIQTLGGDPTVLTPAADVVGVEGIGLVQVLTDPRTTVEQCLGALVMAELADGDGWGVLIDLARAMEHDEMAETFGEALADEAMHLAELKKWLVAALGGVARIDAGPARRITAPPL